MRRGVALGVFVVAIAALVGCSAWLFAVDRSAAVPDNDFFVASAAGALADAIVGAIILARHPRHRIGWILTVSAAVDAIGTLVGEYGPYALTIGRPAPLGVVALWLDSWLWVSAVGLLLLTFSYLPDGRLLSPRWRPLPFALAAGTVLVSLAIALAPGPIGGSHSGSRLARRRQRSRGLRRARDGVRLRGRDHLPRLGRRRGHLPRAALAPRTRAATPAAEVARLGCRHEHRRRPARDRHRRRRG